MRIVTWNLWWRYGPWRQRREAIAATLAELRPDVCGLQEVGGAEADRARDDDGDVLGIGNAILSRWPIAGSIEMRLPSAAGDGGRAVCHAHIEAPGGTLPMFTTHLTYRPGGSSARVAQVRRLAGFVAEHAAGCAYPPVVTGDLNAEPDADEIRLLGGLLTDPAAPGLVLVDAWRYADPAGPGFTWDRRNGYQADSPLPDSRIDYILVGLPRAGRGQVRAVTLGGTAAVDGVWPSDHFAVVADLQP